MFALIFSALYLNFKSAIGFFFLTIKALLISLQASNLYDEWLKGAYSELWTIFRFAVTSWDHMQHKSTNLVDWCFQCVFLRYDGGGERRKSFLVAGLTIKVILFLTSWKKIIESIRVKTERTTLRNRNPLHSWSRHALQTKRCVIDPSVTSIIGSRLKPAKINTHDLSFTAVSWVLIAFRFLQRALWIFFCDT